MRPLRVAVVGGGRSCEHEVSLASAAGVADALRQAGHTVVPLTVERDGSWCRPGHTLDGLAGAVAVLQGCDVVFPVLHGPHGEDGTLAALCELAGVRFVGSGVGAGALAMDKWATKLVAESLGIRTAAGRLLTRSTAATYVFEQPVVVKPVAAGSSHGVSLVRTAAGLRSALDEALAVDDRILVEEVVTGREIDVAVLGRPDGSRQTTSALEIVVDGVFDLRTKYDGSAVFVLPAPLTGAERRSLAGAAVEMYDGLGCAGVARIDFFLTPGGPVLNEVNTTPGLTEASQVPRMFEACGTSYVDLVDLLVRDALRG